MEEIIAQQMIIINLNMINTIKTTLEGQQVNKLRVTKEHHQQSGSNHQPNKFLRYISQLSPPYTQPPQSL